MLLLSGLHCKALSGGLWVQAGFRVPSSGSRQGASIRRRRCSGRDTEQRLRPEDSCLAGAETWIAYATVPRLLRFFRHLLITTATAATLQLRVPPLLLLLLLLPRRPKYGYEMGKSISAVFRPEEPAGSAAYQIRNSRISRPI